MSTQIAYRWLLNTGANIFDPEKIIVQPNFEVNPDTGDIYPSAGLSTSNPIPVVASLPYRILSVAGAIGAFYDAAGAYAGPIRIKADETITAPAGAASMRLTLGAPEFAQLAISVWAETRPIYDNGMSSEWSKEAEQEFFRQTLTGSLTFVGPDFEAIMATDIDTEFSLRLQYNQGAGWLEAWASTFAMTDCAVNLDRRTIIVKPTVQDAYTDILAGYDNEYNLWELPTASVPVDLFKAPILQIYAAGDAEVMNKQGGQTWGIEVDNATSLPSTIENNYHFAAASYFSRVVLSPYGIQSGTTAVQIAGTYVGSATVTSSSSSGQTWEGSLISTEHPNIVITRTRVSNYNVYTVTIKDTATGTTLYSVSDYRSSGEGIVDPPAFQINPASGATGIITFAEYLLPTVYTRYIFDNAAPDILGLDVYRLPDVDILPANAMYRYCAKDRSHSFYISDRLSDEPTQWGNAGTQGGGKYYLPPAGTPGQTFYPIARNKWGAGVSLWGEYFEAFPQTEQLLRTTVTVPDCYTIPGVISALLAIVAPGITHEPTEEYSRFLYSATNPLTGEAAFLLTMTQKTNITRGQYTQAATKTPVSLAMICGMLRDVFRCYWFIEDGKFRIEHVQYFRNGSYSGRKSVGVDLTQLQYLRNGKMWAFGQNEYSYNKQNIPERFEFGWSDDVSDLFEGEPISVLSKFAQKGLTEEVTVSEFTTDLDYAFAHAEDMSEDGYFLIAVRQVDNNILYDTVLPVPVRYGTVMPFPEQTDSVPAVLDIQAWGDIKPRIWWGLGSTTIEAEDLRAALTLTGERQSIEVTIPARAKSLQFTEAPETDPDPGTDTETDPETETDPDGMETDPVTTGVAAASLEDFEAFVYGLNVGKRYRVISQAQAPGGTLITAQNAILSWPYLQRAFWLYDMPGRLLQIGDVPARALSVSQNKQQSVKFPAGWDIDLQKLIKTDIGPGNVSKLSLNLCSLEAQATLDYDTE